MADPADDTQQQNDTAPDDAPAGDPSVKSLDQLVTDWQNAAGEVTLRRNPSVEFLFGSNVDMVQRNGVRLAMIDRGDRLDAAIVAEKSAWDDLVAGARAAGYEVVSQESATDEGDDLVLANW